MTRSVTYLMVSTFQPPFVDCCIACSDWRSRVPNLPGAARESSLLDLERRRCFRHSSRWLRTEWLRGNSSPRFVTTSTLAGTERSQLSYRSPKVKWSIDSWEGVDPEFLHYLRHSMKELLYEFGKGILDVHGLASDSRLVGLRTAATKQMDDYFRNHADPFRKSRFVDPVIQIVEHLPKEELAGHGRSSREPHVPEAPRVP